MVAKSSIRGGNPGRLADAAFTTQRLAFIRHLIDGEAVRSCVVPIDAVSVSQKVVTIEGLSPDGSHPVQQAWEELDVPQCGYCQPGIIMSVIALLNANPTPNDADIDANLTNICRCGTFNRVRRGVHLAVERNRHGSKT